MPFTTDPGAKLQAIAAALADAFASIDEVTALSYEPLGDADIDPPFIAVGPVETARIDPLEAETRLGRVDWDDVWTVRLYVQVDDSETAWLQARRILGWMRAVIDDDFQLGGQVQQASLVRADLAPDEATENAPRRLIGECEVAVKYLMPSP
jgi:hypothetical protein